MTELRQLTGARGIAAWFVVLFHVRQSIAGLPPPLVAVLGKGYLAVDFFFLLSGFVIALTWQARLHDEGFAAVPRFLRKRIARIWPLHLAMLGCALALALALRATGRADPAFPFAELPLHLLLIQNWGFTAALRWNDPAWSISCELAAYLLFPLLACTIDWRRWRTGALLAAAAALLLALHLAMAGSRDLGVDIPRFGLVRCLAEFGTGTILAALWKRGAGRWALPSGLLLLAGWWAGAPETLVVPAAFACLLLALARSRTILRGRAVHALGEASYATYLGHFLLWKVFKLVLVTGGGIAGPAMIILYLACVLLASFALYHGLERPAQRWLNALPPARRAAAPPLPLPGAR